jgi:hypothetical protein
MLTMSDWGWFVRTWNTAPAFASSRNKCASSGAILSILRISLATVIKSRVMIDKPSHISSVASLILEPNVLLHADWNTMLITAVVSKKILFKLLVFNSPRVRQASPFVCSGYQALAPEKLPRRREIPSQSSASEAIQ